MPTLSDLMWPAFAEVFPPDAKPSTKKDNYVFVSIPVAADLPDTGRLHTVKITFNQSVVDAIWEAHTRGEHALIDRVARNCADRIASRFNKLGTQYTSFHMTIYEL